MNRCVILGNLTRDPELKTTTSGKSVCNFTIAVSRRFAGPGGEREADFIPVVVWGKQAENCAKYLKKGSQCSVAGAIQVRNYEANDGSRRYVTEVVADEVQFLSRTAGSGSYQEQDDQYTGGGQSSPSDMQEINEDLPF
jgi:single-strand DNA-binding protein